MTRIAAMTLLYAAASMPVMAAEVDIYAPAETAEPPRPVLEAIKAKIEQVSTFSLLETDGNFSLYGKLSIPRLTANEKTGIRPTAPAYGLRGQFVGTQNMGIKFGWDHYMAGQNTGSNIYSLTAVVKF